MSCFIHGESLMSHPLFIASACLLERCGWIPYPLSTLRTTFSESERAMFKDGLHTSNFLDGEEASGPGLTAAQRLKLLSALERELTSYLAGELVSCVPPTGNTGSARLLSAILHCSTSVWD